jgi:uncharacterized protein YndB with AHSA1/START domain
MTEGNGSIDVVVIEREIDAPVELVWKMWTDPHHFAAWYGPAGATIAVAEMDVRVGGTRRVCMEMPGQGAPIRMWFVGEYLEVDEPRRLVYSESMADEEGKPISPAEMGIDKGHPTTTQVRVELEDDGGVTNMVLTHVGIPAGSAGAVGWAMALDKLTARLAAHSTQ